MVMYKYLSENRHLSALTLFMVYLLVTVAKAPALFASPRFWAEDGVIYYLQARVLPAYEALWAMPLQYLSLPPNLAGILAFQLPLPYAPYASLGVSLFIQLLLFGVVVLNHYFAGKRLKQGILLLLPVLVIQSFETWLNPINSQVWLALAAAYILAAPKEGFTAQRHVLNGATLLLAGLSGVVAAFLAPLFVLRGLWERQWVWLFYSLPVAVGGIILVLAGTGHGRVLSFPLDLFAIRSFFHIILDNVCLPCAYGLTQQPAIVSSGYFALLAAGSVSPDIRAGLGAGDHSGALVNTGLVSIAGTQFCRGTGQRTVVTPTASSWR